MDHARKLSRLTRRMKARVEAGGGGSPVPTEDDLEVLDEVVRKGREAIEVLRDEMDGIRNGRLQVVEELFSRKSNVLKWLELKLPLVEPFIGHPAAEVRELPMILEELRETVVSDSEMLSRMATAAGSVLRELEKVRDRHSLRGTYGRSGEKVGGFGTLRERLDKQL